MELVIKKFYADWCTPCKLLSKILNEIVKEYENIKIVPIDIEDNDEVVSFYDIRNLPTIILLKDDIEIERIVGTKNKEELKEIINKYV